MLGFSLLLTGFVGYVIVCIQLARPGSSLTSDIMSGLVDSLLVCRSAIYPQEVISMDLCKLLMNLPSVYVCVYVTAVECKICSH